MGSLTSKPMLTNLPFKFLFCNLVNTITNKSCIEIDWCREGWHPADMVEVINETVDAVAIKLVGFSIVRVLMFDLIWILLREYIFENLNMSYQSKEESNKEAWNAHLFRNKCLTENKILTLRIWNYSSRCWGSNHDSVFKLSFVKVFTWGFFHENKVSIFSNNLK